MALLVCRMRLSNLRGMEDMVGFEGVDAALRDANAIAGTHERLSGAEVGEFEVRATLRAVPDAYRQELLAKLRAAIRTDITHTVKESFNA